MTLTLVRHAAVPKRFRRRYNGHIDIGLGPEGAAQARRLAARLRTERFDAVCCSDLRRCRDTLAPLRPHLEGVPVHFTPELREKSWGRHEGMTFDAIVRRDGLRYENFRQWLGALDGEPYDAYLERIGRFFFGHLREQGASRVLVVTHAGVIRSLMHLALEIPLEEAFSVDFPYAAYTVASDNPWQFGAVQCV